MNNYNPTTYTGSTYGNNEETSSQQPTQETQATNNQPLSQSELESFFKEWLDKTITQSTNLSEQSKIIKDKHKQNDALLKENEELRAKISELEKSILSGDTYSKMPDMSEFNNKINAMEQQLNDFKKQEALRKMEPLIELVKSYNVPREDVNKIWTGIKSEYGVDIVANPNSKLVKTYLDEIYGKQVEQSIPQGGYTPRVQNTQSDEALYQQRKQAFLNEMYTKIKNNKQI